MRNKLCGKVANEKIQKMAADEEGEMFLFSSILKHFCFGCG
jgi:hypothetical protein